MSAYRSKVKLTVDLAKLKKSGMEPYKTQKAIYNFFMGKGFTYHRHFGFIYDRELTKEEWIEIAVELDDNGWFQNFNSFDTDIIGEIRDLTYLFTAEEDENGRNEEK